MSNSNEFTIQQIVRTLANDFANVRDDHDFYKNTRRKLRKKFATSHDHNERWTFKKNSSRMKILCRDILNVDLDTI